MKNRTIILVTMLPLWSMNNGCGGKALFNTVDMLSKSDYNFYLITNQKNDYSKLNINRKNVVYIDTEWYFDKIKNNRANKITTLKYYAIFKKIIIKELGKIIDSNKNKDIIIYAYEVQTVLGCRKIATKYNLPLITRFQGTIMSQYEDKLKYRILKYPHVQALSTKADLIIMTDDGTQGDKVLKQYKNDSKLLFIRNGVNILDEKIIDIDVEKTKKEFNIPKNKTILLTCSRLESWKRVDRAILAFSKIKDWHNYCLIIIGDGAELTNLIKLTKDLAIDSNVRFTGAVKNQDVKKYMQLADIFLSFYDLSNVGNPLLEALCLGKPIITYDIGDTNKIINGTNGILLSDVSPEYIALNIERINNKKTLNMLSKKSKEYSEKNLYSWSKRMNIEKNEIDKLFNGEKNEKKE